MTSRPQYTINEERANSITHAIGALLGIAAAFILLPQAANSNILLAIPCVLTYLFGILFSYGISTTYHAAKSGKCKQLLRKFDHAAIYVHIAATYTPFTLLVLNKYDWWGYGLFGFVWLVTIIGFALSFIKLKEHSHLETVCYIGMGCSTVVVIKTLWEALSAINPMSFYLLMSGGALFIIGAALYSLHKIRYAHSIFHVFCLLGSICHIGAIYLIFPT